MKSRILRKWSLGLTLSILPLAGGCLQQANSAPEPTVAVAGAETGSNAVAEASETTTNAVEDIQVPEVDIAEAPYKPVTTEKPLPTNIRTNGPTGEIIRLADSGVDEGVLLAFVTNSTSIFNLGAEEIIYLNDIGVPGPVVTAMLQHDQALKASSFWNASTPTNQYAPAPTAQPGPQPGQATPEAAAPQGTYTETPPPAPPSPSAEPSYGTFYNSLSPYGTWVEIDGYGRCWQPSAVVVNPSWQPYSDAGHWVYSDAGWYWVSDYSWGWAPFHYGRWFRHYRLGWCWYPDYVWGPSWVTWRYTDGYCGWAPLPPCAWYRPSVGLTYWGRHVGVNFTFGLGVDCFTFIPWGHFNDHRWHQFRAPRDHRDRIFHQSVVATRIVGNRRTVFNQGLPVERVTAATHTQVRKVTIRETTTTNFRGGRAERLASDGKSLTVYRPRIPESTRTPIERVQRTRTEPGKAGGALAGSPAPVPTVRNATPTRPSRNITEAATPRPTKTWERPVPAASPAITRLADERPAGSSSARPVENTRRDVSRPQTRTTPLVTPSHSAGGTTPEAPMPSSRGERQPVRSSYAPVQNSSPAVNAQSAPSATAAPQAPTRSTRGNVIQPRQASPTPRTSWGSETRTTTTPSPAPAQRETRTPSYQAPQQARQYTPPPAPAQRQYTPQTPTYQAPSRVAEVPRYTPAPAPAQREARTPAYESPRSSAAPSAPQAQRSYSAPAPSARSESSPAPRSESRSAPSSSRSERNQR